MNGFTNATMAASDSPRRLSRKTIRNKGDQNMNLVAQAQKIKDDHLAGKLSIRQFLHKLNRLITVRAEEPTVCGIATDNQVFIQTMNAELIADVLDDDGKIVAHEMDGNGFIKKVRALYPDKEHI